jgi:hypothetical protein
MDLLDIEVVPRPEPEFTGVTTVHNASPARESSNLPVDSDRRRPSRKRTAVEINFGHADGMSKAEFVRLVKDSTGISSHVLGKITLGERHTHVEVCGRDVDKVKSGLCRQTFKGKAVQARVI